MFPVERKHDDSWPTDILFADSAMPFFGNNEEGIYGRWYRTAFCFYREGQGWIASSYTCPAAEYDLMSANEGLKQRIDEAEIAALGYLMQMKNAGLFDESRKADFASE